MSYLHNGPLNRTASLTAGSYDIKYSGVAQLEERHAVNMLVARSNRAAGASLTAQGS